MAAFEASWGKLYEGDARDVLRELPNNSVDALISDPPAGISFMGLAFDSDKGGRDKWIAWLAEIMREARRVVKPGGHALIWALPRTSHWTAMALEDAGWECRDKLYHLFGSGFPKSLDVSRAIDQALGKTREKVRIPISPHSTAGKGSSNEIDERPWLTKAREVGYNESAGPIPATEEARRWAGWHSALKPAVEEWILCRKPLSENTVAKNVLKHGTGGLNIGATRVGAEVGLQRSGRQSKGITGGWANYTQPKGLYGTPDGIGRFPSHLILSHSPECRPIGTIEVQGNGHYPASRGQGGLGTAGHKGQDDLEERKLDKEIVQTWQCVEGCAVAELDRQSGKRKAGGVVKGTEPSQTGQNGIYGTYQRVANQPYQDTGGASRFFQCLEPEVPFIYMPKASRADRDEGCEELPEQSCGMMEDDNYPIKTGSGNLRDTKRRNIHPTVKNTKLMQILARLITPPNGVILDCFMGSGSTGVAALREGFRFIGVEKEAEYYAIARARICHEANKPRQTNMLGSDNA